MLGEYLDQRKLAGGERRRLSIALECAGGQIEHLRAESDAALLGRCAHRGALAVAAKHCVNARHELAWIEGFRQIVVGAHFQADDSIDVLAFRRQHDDRHRLAGAAQPAANGQSIFARQHQVEDDEMRRIALQFLVELTRIC